MNNIIIKTENLGKSYVISHESRERYFALRDVISNKTKHIIQNSLAKFKNAAKSKKLETFWALSDVNFEVLQGDCIGIIGRNGAGKSTLLKLLSRITEPTTGQITLKGRIASLLEVGTGFHPELTGRENIFLNGSILGMKRAEIKNKFDEIIDFSGVEKFLDTPVKRYSSGMYVRLAFAVAAHLEPEILIIDEVLAVGDADFQKKCLGKMESVSKNNGRTVLFVSHNLAAVKNLCSKGIVMDKGKIGFTGPINETIDYYISNRNTNDALGTEKTFPPDPNKDLQLLYARVCDTNLQPRELFECDEDIFIILKIDIRKRIPGLYAWMNIIKMDIDTEVLCSESRDLSPKIFESLSFGISTIKITIPRRLLISGEYSVFMWFGTGIYNADYPKNILAFKLCDSTSHRGHDRSGYVSTLLKWEKDTSLLMKD